MAARQDELYVPLECASRHEHARSHRNPADSRAKPNSESGQAILLLIVSLSLFMLGAVGLGIDGAQIYAHYQMAQAAADAAAQAGMMSIYDGTNATSAYPFATGITPATFVCTTTDQRVPCVYARFNGFGSTNSDTVTVSFPATVLGVALSAETVPAIQVVVQRVLPTALMKFLGKSNTQLSAKAVAANVSANSPAALLITHPTLAGAISMGSNSSIQVCGGPSRSIQVNSTSALAVSGGTFDLSHGGPNDPGNCTTGTGSNFAVFGGPSAPPAGLTLGSTGSYLQPASPVLDPYASIPAPAVPSTAPAKSALANGLNGCPASPPKSCRLYSPGYYGSGISVTNETAVFRPGLYYIGAGGFGNAANGNMVMATGFAADPATGSGMVVYNTGVGTFSLGSNASALLIGSDNTSTYQGILLFQDRAAPAQTHHLGGGGSLTLQGSLYITNSLALMQADASRYQTLSFAGNASIIINGIIIVSALSMGGTTAVFYNLSGVPSLSFRQVALVS